MNKKQQAAWDINPMKQTRAMLGLSQESMARQLQCSVFTVSRHENNTGRTTNLWRLALKQLLIESVNGAK